MQHIAIDLGGRTSQVCVRSGCGRIVGEHKVATELLGRFLSGQPRSRVVMETCAESFAVAGWAREAGHEIRIIAATSVRALGVGARGIKTDVRDAQVLSDVSTKIDLASVHVPTELAKERRARCTARETLVEARTQLVNSVRGYLRQRVLRVRSTTETLPRRVRETLVQTGDGLPSYIEHLLAAIEGLNTQILAADEELKALAKSDDVCRLLMTIPGVGAVTSMRYVAAIDDIQRFHTAEQVCSYLGLTPGENTTGFKPKRTGITKAGPAGVRRALTQAAWTLWRWRAEDPIVRWAKGVAERRGKLKAIVALSRKLAAVMSAMWRTRQPYNPKHLERSQQASA